MAHSSPPVPPQPFPPPLTYAGPPVAPPDSALTLIGYGLISALIPCIGVIIALVQFGQGKSTRGVACLSGAALGIVLGVLIMGSTPSRSSSYSSSDSGFSSGSSTSSLSSAPTISLSQYNQIQPGMSYSQVVAIIGTSGTEMSSNRIEGVPGVMESIETVMYSWQNEDGSNMNAMFQNGSLISKAQFGLN